MSSTAQARHRVRRRGHPPHRGAKSSQRSFLLERLVRFVVSTREPHDEQAVTANSRVVTHVLRIGRRYLGRALTADETTQLRELARSAKPSEITRRLYRWQYDLTDREMRGLQSYPTLLEAMWA